MKDKVNYISRLKKERDNYMETFEVSVWNKYSPGYDCDSNIEITDYGSFSILIKFKTWTEKIKEIKMR